MPILILILLAILGGVPLVLGGIAAFAAWTIAKVTIAGLLVLVIAATLVVVAVGWLILGWLWPRKPAQTVFLMPALTEQFKRDNLQVETGIWKHDNHFIVEIGGRPKYYRFLRKARLTRDTGIVQ